MITFTIATVCYNAARWLRPTIRSVETQDYPHVEHIIVDGASHDETLAQLHHYRQRNAAERSAHRIVVRSEPDHGIYDAMNKALGLATGNYVLFLNAGDRLHTPSTLSHIASAIERRQPGAELPAVVYGHTHLIDADGRFLRPRRLVPPERLSWRSFRKGMLVCHQAFLARRDLAQAQHYDTAFRYSADFDWCIRIMQRAEQLRLPLLNTHSVLADYLAEGTTTAHHKASLRERFHIMRRHYGSLPTLGMHLWFAVRALLKP